jgi:thioredoxin-like negative regulator of GroEL
VHQLDQFDFHPYLSGKTGTTLVSFISPDCGACRHLHRILGEVNSRRPDWTLCVVDAQRDAALTREFEVFHLPTLFLFSNGEFHCELQAEAQPEKIIDAVTAALQQPAQEAP